jgi:signal transduction histidine kinase
MVVLIALAGYGASRRARQIYAEIDAIHEADSRRARLLDEVRSGMHLSSIFIRDYLLDPSPVTAPRHREQLLQIRDAMSRQLDELVRVVGQDEAAAVGLLRTEIDAYWSSMDPVFDWTSQQKIALSTFFLRQRVLPRREAVRELTGEIRELNRMYFERQQKEVNRNLSNLGMYLWRMIGISVSLGILVAAASVFRITRLERRTEEQQRRTERAERELRRLSQELVKAQEAERKSISRELHDEVGQALTALRLELVKLEESRAASPEAFRDRVAEVKQLAEKTLGSVRHIAMGLRPAMLDDLGLGPALEWQGREFFRRTGIPITVQIAGLLDGLPDSHRTCVFRVVQEALTNCAKHAKAENIRVVVHGAPDLLSVTVQDDGEGIGQSDGGTRGLGLLGIEERVRELGGTIEVVSQPAKGTLLRAEIPVARESK